MDELVGCIVENMGHDNLFCDNDNLKRHIVDKGVLREWIEGFDWDYYDNCEGRLGCGLSIPSENKISTD